MRAAIVVGALAATALAAPAVKTIVEVVEVFTTVTVQAAPAPTYNALAEPQQPNNNNWWWPQNPPASSSRAPAPQSSPQYIKLAAHQSTPAAAPAAAPVAAKPSYNSPNGDTYVERCLDHHNAHRDNHSVPALSWDSNLAAIAMQIAQSCVYAHNVVAGGGGYGQNIAAGAPADNITSIITDLFYNDEIGFFANSYGQPSPLNMNDPIDNTTYFEKYGHYTQIVWGATTHVGCASYDCGAGNLGNVAVNVPPIFTVCNYSPPGNVIGEFDKQVNEPEGQPSIGWSYKYNNP